MLGGIKSASFKNPWFFVFLLLALFVYILPAIDYFNVVPGGLGDARFNSVILEHVFRWVTGNEEHLWSPRFFYPFENVLAFSDNHFGSCLPYIVSRLLGMGREHAYDMWFLIGNVLNIAAAYVVMRRFGISQFGSAAGAFVYALALPALPRENHAQLVYRFAIPFAAYALVEVLQSRRAAGLWRVVFWVTVQFFCSIYLGLFLSYLLLAILLAWVLLGKSRGLLKGLYASLSEERANVLASAVAVSVLSVFALTWLLYSYYLVSQDYGLLGENLTGPVNLPMLSSYLLADDVNLSAWMGALVQGVPTRWEHQMFFGIGAWCLGLYGLFATWKDQRHGYLGKVMGLSLVILVFLTLKVDGHSIYHLLAKLPGISAVRAVSRVVLVMLFPVAVLVALGAEDLMRKWGTTQFKQLAVCTLVLIGVGLEVATYRGYYSNTVGDWQQRLQAVRSLLPEQMPDDPIINITDFGSGPYYLVELDGMILAQDLGVATLNGYSGRFPPGYFDVTPCHPNNRLVGYAEFRKITAEALSKLQRRVVHLQLGPEPCQTR